MRVLLVNPKPKRGGAKREECCTGSSLQSVLPAQLFLCTEYLRQQGWHTDFVDQQVDDTVIQYADYDVVVGWAATGVELDRDMLPLKEASKIGIRTVLILQGAPLLDEEAMARFPYLSAAIKEPEREITLAQLLTTWSGGSSNNLPRGLVYRAGDKLIDIGTASFADSWGHLGSTVGILNGLDLSRYASALVLGGKGCPYGCTYCKFARTPLRHRNPEDVAKEMIIIGRSGLKVLLLNQEFLTDREWAEKLCDGVTGAGVDWRTLIRADHITTETARMLKRAGCTCVMIGAETGDEDILQRIRKGCTVEKVIEAARICHPIDLGCHFSFVVGFPWDTQETILKTHTLMEALYPATYSVQTLFPQRGTVIYGEMQEMGLINGEVQLESYCRRISTEPMFPGLHLAKHDIETARKDLENVLNKGGKN